MGGWHLEIFKMAMYMTFPVAMFHYFNQPEYFEKWVNQIHLVTHRKINLIKYSYFQVTETKRQLYPPEKKGHRDEIEVCKNAIMLPDPVTGCCFLTSRLQSDQ